MSLPQRQLPLSWTFFFSKTQKILEIPELAYKVLANMLQYMFPLYLDKKSRLHLITFNDLLIKNSIDKSLKSILNSLETHANAFVDNSP